MVIYADDDSITVNYVPDDFVGGIDPKTGKAINGYTVHIEGITPDNALLTQYRADNAAGRTQLPVLKGGQTMGTAAGTVLKVAIRDTGTLEDPRSVDFWAGGTTKAVVK